MRFDDIDIDVPISVPRMHSLAYAAASRQLPVRLLIEAVLATKAPILALMNDSPYYAESDLQKALEWLIAKGKVAVPTAPREAPPKAKRQNAEKN